MDTPTDSPATEQANQAPPEENTRDIAVEVRAALNLPEDAGAEAILERIGELNKATEQASGAADLQTKLDLANARIAEFEAAEAQRVQTELDALLEGYDLDDEERATVLDILRGDRAKGEKLLAKMPKKTAEPEQPLEETPSGNTPETTTEEPPKPMHNPGQTDEMSVEQKSAKIDELIAEIRKEGKFKGYTEAREEARRREPQLFA